MSTEDVEMQTEQTTKEKNNPEDWVRIVSNDGYSFLVRRKLANVSGTMKNALESSGGFSEAETKTYEAHDQRGIIVQKMIEYMAFKAYHEGLNAKEEVPIQEFLERIPPEIVLELLLAADYQEM